MSAKARSQVSPIFVSGDTAAALPTHVFRVKAKSGRTYFYFQRGRRLPKDQRGPLIKLYGEPGSVQFVECVAAAERRDRKEGGRKRIKPEGSYVYFLVVGETLKVGYSRDPIGRLESLQGGLAMRITSMTIVPGTRQLERRIHDALAADRMQGEWFRMTTKAAALVSAAVAGCPVPGGAE